MRVHFKKTGERRYGVWVERELAPAMMMHPAPGFDPYLPHDVLHFVAEVEWGIDESVFGQLAAGGDAGTFWPVDRQVPNKWAHRGERLRKLGSGRRSERLAGLLEIAWHTRRSGAALPAEWRLRLEEAGIDDPARFDRVVVGLDALARRWQTLQVGGVLTLEWPRPEGRPLRPTRSSASRAGRRAGGAIRARSGGRARG
jgi:hypothetical protein